MAKIIENTKGRRSIRLSIDDVISIVREYQNVVNTQGSYVEIREILSKSDFYLPEEL